MQMRVPFLLCAAAVGRGMAGDAVTPWEIIEQNGGLAPRQCPGREGTLRVDRVSFNSSTLAVQAGGTLTRELTGGRVVATITPGGAPAGASRWQRAKRKMALSWARALPGARPGEANQTGPLCSKQRPCPLAVGAQRLDFSFARLPRRVVAGGYRLQLEAYDQAGGLVVCVEGALTVGHGGRGEVIRVLEDCVNTPWSEGKSGDEQCQTDIVAHGLCDNPSEGYQAHVNMHCRKACNRCPEQHGDHDTSGADRGRVSRGLAGLFVVALYNIF